MQTLTRSGIVLFAIVLLSMALLPLAQTNWAGGVRTSLSQPTMNESEAQMEAIDSIPVPIRFLLGLLRPTIFILVPGWIAYKILNTVKRRSGILK